MPETERAQLVGDLGRRFAQYGSPLPSRSASRAAGVIGKVETRGAKSAETGPGGSDAARIASAR
jgi:hypothetical protein